MHYQRLFLRRLFEDRRFKNLEGEDRVVVYETVWSSDLQKMCGDVILAILSLFEFSIRRGQNMRATNRTEKYGAALGVKIH
jgi:hypothetical protein